MPKKNLYCLNQQLIKYISKGAWKSHCLHIEMMKYCVFCEERVYKNVSTRLSKKQETFLTVKEAISFTIPGI